MTTYFDDTGLLRYEGDEMPTEQEFIASLSSSVKSVKVPELEATEAQLERFPRAQAEADKVSPQPAAPPAGTRYPPLESPGR